MTDTQAGAASPAPDPRPEQADPQPERTGPLAEQLHPEPETAPVAPPSLVRAGCYAVLIGNAVFEDKDLQDVPAVRRSLDEFEEMLLSTACGWRRTQILKLADWGNRAQLFKHVLEQIDKAKPHTLLFLYVGHGNLVDGTEDLAMALRDSSSHWDSRGIDSLLLSDVRKLMSHAQPDSARIAIFDCCFSGLAAVKGPFLGDEELSERVQRVATIRGALTLTASGTAEAVYEPDDNGLTYYCRFFTDVVREGIRGAGQFLTIRNIQDEVENRFARMNARDLVRGGRREVRPEPRQVHSGNADQFPFAVNARYDPADQGPGPGPDPEPESWWLRNRRWVLGVGAGVGASLLGGGAFAAVDRLGRSPTTKGGPRTTADPGSSITGFPTRGSSSPPTGTPSPAPAPITMPTTSTPVGSTLTVGGSAGVAFSGDGPELLATFWPGGFRLWRAADLASVTAAGAATAFAASNPVSAAAFAPGRRLLAVGTMAGEVVLYSTTPSGATLRLSSQQDQANGISCLSFSPDGTSLASAALDQTIVVWDVSAPSRFYPLAVLDGHTAAVNTVAFSPTSNTVLASGGYDDTVRVWNISNPSLAAQQVLGSRGGVVWSVAFTPDGATLASGTAAGAVELWNVRRPGAATPLGTLPDPQLDQVLGLACSRDFVLASASRDGTVHLADIHDPNNPARVGPPLTGTPSIPFMSAAFTPDGLGLAVADGDGLVRFWRLS